MSSNPSPDPLRPQRRGPRRTARETIAGAERRRAFRVATAVALLGFAVSAAAGLLARSADDDGRRAHLERDAAAAAESIDRRLQGYAEALVGLRGLVEAEPSLSHERFHAYVRSLRIQARYPGIQAISFLPLVERFERERHEAAVNASARASGESYPPYRILAPGNRLEYLPIAFVDPVYGNRKAIGFDILSEPARRAAVARTQSTGELAATAPLDLVQNPDAGPAFLMILAVRNVTSSTTDPQTGRLEGVVDAVFVAEEMLGTVLPRDTGEFEFEVYDAGALDGPVEPPVTLFDLDGSRDYDPAAERDNALTSTLDVAGRRWLVYYERRGVAADAGDTPPLVALAGVLFSLLAALLAYLLLTGRARAVALAQRMTVELESARMELARANEDLRDAAEVASRAEERFRRTFDHSPIGVALVASDGRIELANRQLETITGLPLDELTGRRLEELIHRDDLAQFRHERDGLRDDVTGTSETELQLDCGGRMVWSSIRQTLLRDEAGDPSETLVQIEDIGERRSYEARLREQAAHDPLTGLFNRRGFMDELRRHAAERGRSGDPVALLMIDIDNFKDINDLFGHAAGDELLAKLGHLLSARLRETDTVARIGGDEFAIVLPRADEGAALEVANEIVAQVREIELSVAAGHPSMLTVSVGIAMLEEEHRGNVEAVLVNADLAMYEAKQSGRDRVIRFSGDQGMLKLAEARLSWRDRLTRAVEEGGLELFAQPIVALGEAGSSRVPTRFELLLRMHDEQGGLIAPGDFMAMTERLGMMRSIDRWVVDRAITTLADHQRPERELTLHVNVSGSSIGDEALLDLIEQRLGETALDPRCLVIEVTETAAIPEMLAGRAWTERLAGLGCRLALDDFGAGFGSFHYLKHLRFDFLKIDGEFVKQAGTSATDRVLISAAVGIAHGLGCETIAEWVGDANTVELLVKLGVDSGQGFYLGRPLPLDQALSSTPAAE